MLMMSTKKRAEEAGVEVQFWSLEKKNVFVCVCVRLKKRWMVIDRERRGHMRGWRKTKREENQWFKCRVLESVELKVRTGLFALARVLANKTKKRGWMKEVVVEWVLLKTKSHARERTRLGSEIGAVTRPVLRLRLTQTLAGKHFICL